MGEGHQPRRFLSEPCSSLRTAQGQHHLVRSNLTVQKLLASNTGEVKPQGKLWAEAGSFPHLDRRVPGAVLVKSFAELSALCTCTPTDLGGEGRRDPGLRKQRGHLRHAADGLERSSSGLGSLPTRLHLSRKVFRGAHGNHALLSCSSGQSWHFSSATLCRGRNGEGGFWWPPGRAELGCSTSEQLLLKGSSSDHSSSSLLCSQGSIHRQPPAPLGLSMHFSFPDIPSHICTHLHSLPSPGEGLSQQVQESSTF